MNVPGVFAAGGWLPPERELAVRYAVGLLAERGTVIHHAAAGPWADGSGEFPQDTFPDRRDGAPEDVARAELAEECGVVGWPGASQPPAPTDPGVSLSAHRALVILVTRRAGPKEPISSARTCGGTFQ